MFEQLHLGGEETKGKRKKWNTKVKNNKQSANHYDWWIGCYGCPGKGYPTQTRKRDVVCIEGETRWGQGPATGQIIEVQRATKCAWEWGQEKQKVRSVLRVLRSVFKNPCYFFLTLQAFLEHPLGASPGIMRWIGNRVLVYSHSVSSSGKRGKSRKLHWNHLYPIRKRFFEGLWEEQLIMLGGVWELFLVCVKTKLVLKNFNWGNSMS